MRNAAVREAIKTFFKTTTLHGFKYLYTTHYADRMGWLLCCCASACCAGILCAVLWARFLEVPALLTLWDYTDSIKNVQEKMPTVVVCPPMASVAEMFLEKLSPNKSMAERIPVILERVFNGKPTARDQLELFDEFLDENYLDLSEVIMRYTPNCKEHIKRCRYQEFMVPCKQLFEIELMTWGLCCVMKPIKLKNFSNNLIAKTHTSEMLELVLECTHSGMSHGCQFITIYEREENLKSSMVMPGNYYIAQLKFIAVPESSMVEKLVENACVPDKEYSRSNCLLRCAESFCGCRDPFHPAKDFDKIIMLPICRVTQMSCLRRSASRSNITCNCLPSCEKITTFMYLESSPMKFIEYTVDPFYAGLNVTPSIIVNLRVNIGHSRIFVLNPTETWLTLLSSLGGVFNMFLGVGLFSALELLFFIFVRLPKAIRKSSEIDPTANNVARPVYRY